MEVTLMSANYQTMQCHMNTEKICKEVEMQNYLSSNINDKKGYDLTIFDKGQLNIVLPNYQRTNNILLDKTDRIPGT